MMGMPEQVRKQMQLAEEFDKKVATDKETAAPPEPNPDTAQPPETQAPTPAPPPPEDAALWKQRFLSLQGMFNHQVPLLQSQVKNLTKENEELKQKLEERPAPTPTASDTASPLVTDQDVTAFGADLVDMVRRAGREEAAKITAAQVHEMAELKRKLAEATQHVSQVTQNQVKTAQESFFSKLDERLPPWEEIQASDQCQTWLMSRVPGAQHTWDDTIKGAAARHDADGVLEVFEEYFKNFPAARPGKPQPAPAPSNRAELARQVTPTKTASASPTPNSQPRVYTSKEYSEESMKVIRLAQRGQFKEASALEAELNAALAQGRVKP